MDRLAWDLGNPAGAVKPLSGGGNPPLHNLGAGIPGLAVGQTSPAFENFHPMKGPMTTQTLQGIIGMEPHHWRGDRNGLEEFNPAFVGLQGDDVSTRHRRRRAHRSGDAAVRGLPGDDAFPPNPFRNFDNTLPTDLELPRQFAHGRFTLPTANRFPTATPHVDCNSTAIKMRRSTAALHLRDLPHASDGRRTIRSCRSPVEYPRSSRSRRDPMANTI